MSEREWQQVDEMWRAGRGNLNESDLCFFYFVRDDRGFRGSHDNDVMYDFKHDPAQYPPGTRPYEHKMKAVEECAGHLAGFLEANKETFRGLDVCLVPMPTSHPRGSESFDSRIDLVCEMATERVAWVGVHKVLDVTSDLPKSHLGGSRDVEFLSENIVCHRIPPTTVPTFAILVDDVLTTGAHYAACKRAMRAANPRVEVMGLFLSIYVRRSDYGYGS